MPANPLSLERQNQIANLVENIRLSTGLFYPHDSLVSIIKSTIPDCHITESDFNGKSNLRGAIFRKSKDYKTATIAINTAQSEPEKIFTLAHEFAHYMLKHDGDTNYFIDDKPFDGSESMQLEGEANFFASILLIPKEMFLKLDLPFVNDAQLAKYFGVSESMIGVRRSWIERNGF